MCADLIVQPITLKYDVISPGKASMEKPVEVQSPGASFPDGTFFDLASLAKGKAGYLVFRQRSALSVSEVWDTGSKTWKMAAGLALSTIKPMDLSYKDGATPPWQGLMVAAGQKDAAQQDVFEAEVNGYPSYTVQAIFSGEFTGQAVSGLSSLSAPFKFGSVMDKMQAGINTGGHPPEQATEISLFLRNASKQTIGSLHIFVSGAGAEVAVANFNAAGATVSTVRLLSNGQIRLEPGAGQRVIVAGDLETEHIIYLPAASSLGSPKVTLP